MKENTKSHLCTFFPVWESTSISMTDYLFDSDHTLLVNTMISVSNCSGSIFLLFWALSFYNKIFLGLHLWFWDGFHWFLFIQQYLQLFLTSTTPIIIYVSLYCGPHQNLIVQKACRVTILISIILSRIYFHLYFESWLWTSFSPI